MKLIFICIDKSELDSTVALLGETLRDLRVETLIRDVYRMQLNYAPVAGHVLNQLVYHLARLHGELKLMCAECLLAALVAAPASSLDALLCLAKQATFLDMLDAAHEDVAVQLVALRITHELIVAAADAPLVDLVTHLLPIVCSVFVRHSNVACRYQLVLVLAAVDAKTADAKSGAVDSEPEMEGRLKSARKLVSDTMLAALLDDDEMIRLMAQNYWTQKVSENYLRIRCFFIIGSISRYVMQLLKNMFATSLSLVMMFPC